MKKISMLLLLVAFSINLRANSVDLWDGITYASSFESGDGTKGDPYVICTGAQMAFFLKSLSKGKTYANQYVVLANNIDLDGHVLPSTGDYFGDFNGCNHILIGCSYSIDGYLFRNLYGTVRNLCIYSQHNADYSSLTYQVQTSGLIFNCNNIISGRSGGYSHYNYTSAFTYQNHGQIVQCCSSGQAYRAYWIGSSENGHAIYQGGLVYYNLEDGTILNCRSSIVSWDWYSQKNNNYIFWSNLGNIYNDIDNNEIDYTKWLEWKSLHLDYEYSQKFDSSRYQCHLVFHDPLGLVSYDPLQIDKGSTIGVLPTPKCDCTFLGWMVEGEIITKYYIVKSDIIVEASWKQNIKQQPSFESPTFVVEDAEHATYQWFRGEPNITYYADWTSTNHANASTGYKEYTITAKARDVLNFDWVVSSEEYDYLYVTLNNSQLIKKSGDDSGQYEYVFAADGTYTLRATYTKDSSGSSGDDMVSIKNIALIDNYSVNYSLSGQTTQTLNKEYLETGYPFFCKVTYSNSETILISDVIQKEVPILPATVVASYKASADDDWTDLSVVNGKLLVNDAFWAFSVEMESTVDEVAYSRTFGTEKWQSLYLPFDVAVADFEGKFDVAYVNNFVQYANDNGMVDHSSIEIMQVRKGVLFANTPYFIRAHQTSDSPQVITFHNVTLKPTASGEVSHVESAVSKADFYGTYTTIDKSVVTGDHLFVVSGGDFKWLNQNVKCFRTYMKLTAKNPMFYVEPEETISIRVFGEDDATNVNFNENENEDENAVVYDLQGRKVDTPKQGGIYIVNGRKTFIR